MSYFDHFDKRKAQTTVFSKKCPFSGNFDPNHFMTQQLTHINTKSPENDF